MILPSEDDSRKPGDPKPPGSSGDQPDAPWEESHMHGFSDEEDEEDADPYGDGQKVESPAPPGWREELKEALLEAVDDLREIEDPAEEFDPPEPPDLFTFYGELVAMRNELRRGMRRPPEKTGAADPDKTQPAVMALIYLHDRVAAGEKKVASLLESAMQQAGLQRIKTEDAGFDAATMIADGPAPATGAKVRRELEAGFLWNGQVLRPARVVIA
ncbi:MAG TPA: nucleotide exchange factor GrpE [Verrucomicrobiales bacterium]|nr:nucleotide exchange factor GrpE [Verrucomicrobiales bacterium]